MLAEVIKSDQQALVAFLEGAGYEVIAKGLGVNLLAVHRSDPTRQHIQITRG